MLVPLLSEYDPKQSQEGSLDPLGLYAIADALAVLLVPGVRERQVRPRFLTASAVSLAVCSEFDEERVAIDGTTSPRQIFEWYVVEGLVRVLGTSGRLNRVPGTEKVKAAVKDKIPVSKSCYLKTPSVFGFQGVYRVLARELRIEYAEQLGETGYDLLMTWAKEQGLEGFFDSTGGPGGKWRKTLSKAVEESLSKGHTCRSGAWEGWQFFADHLAPDAMGIKEGKTLINALLHGGTGYRKSVMEFLVRDEGQQALTEVESGKGLSEKKFHNELIKTAGSDLRYLLETICKYERFSRLLQDAFDECLYEMSIHKQHLSPQQLCGCRGVKKASEHVPELYEVLLDMLLPYELSYRFQEAFSDVAERLTPEVWVVSLLQHHRRTQGNKPPNGKAPWFERFDDGSYIVRPAYLREQGGLHEDEYVHYYRTGPLLSFARDLGMVN